MKKIILQGVLLVLLFVGSWFGLSQVHWMSILKVDYLMEKVPEKLGNLYWEYFRGQEEEVLDEKVLAPIDSLVSRICTCNHFDSHEIKIHVLSYDDVNAFSLPNRHLVIYSGLLKAAETEDELSSVLCHEIAHMERNHVMKKLIREIGLSTLLANASGGGDNEFIIETAKFLTNSAYNRSWEKEADALAIEYMKKAKLDVEGFAQMLERISNNKTDLNEHLTWISTHPNTAERIEIIRMSDSSGSSLINPVLSPQTWALFEESIQ